METAAMSGLDWYSDKMASHCLGLGVFETDSCINTFGVLYWECLAISPKTQAMNSNCVYYLNLGFPSVHSIQILAIAVLSTLEVRPFRQNPF